jgi:hypothetical protein
VSVAEIESPKPGDNIASLAATLVEKYGADACDLVETRLAATEGAAHVIWTEIWYLVCGSGRPE